MRPIAQIAVEESVPLAVPNGPSDYIFVRLKAIRVIRHGDAPVLHLFTATGGRLRTTLPAATVETSGGPDPKERGLDGSIGKGRYDKSGQEHRRGGIVAG